MMPDGTIEDEGWAPYARGQAMGDYIGQWLSPPEKFRRRRNAFDVARLAILAGVGGAAAGISTGWGDAAIVAMALFFPLALIVALYALWPDQIIGNAGVSMLWLPAVASGDALVRERLAASVQQVGHRIEFENKSSVGLKWSLEVPISVHLQHGATGKPNRLVVRGRGPDVVRMAFAGLKGHLLQSFLEPANPRLSAAEEE